MEFVRSSAACGSGATSVFYDTLQPREQINALTSFIDASQVRTQDDKKKNERLASHQKRLLKKTCHSVFYDTLQPREQKNALTSFIDASQVCFISVFTEVKEVFSLPCSTTRCSPGNR